MPTYNRLVGGASRLFRNIISDPDLVFFVPMNEASGSILDRCTKNIINGVVSGDPTYGKALANGFCGLDLDGTGDYVDFGNAAALGFTYAAPWSILMVINPNISADGTLISKGALPGWEILIWSTRTIAVFLRAAGGSIVVTSNAALTNGVPIMLMVTYSGSGAASGVTMYVNGAAYADTDTTDTLAGGVITNSSPVQIGVVGNTTRPFNGDIGFAAVFNAVKTAEDARRYAWLGRFL